MSKKPKIGQGSLKAAGRQGGKEIGQAVPAFPDSIRVVEEAGTIGNPVPHEVAKQTGAIDRDFDSRGLDAQRFAGNVWGTSPKGPQQQSTQPNYEPEQDFDYEP